MWRRGLKSISKAVIPWPVTWASSENSLECRFSGSLDLLNQLRDQTFRWFHIHSASVVLKLECVYLSEDRSDSKLPKYILAAELVVWHESLMPASDVSKNYADVWGWGQSTQSWINDSDKQSFPRVWAHVPQRAAGKRPAASSKGICGQRVRKGLEEKSDRERELQGGERVDLVRNEQSPSKE